jgi:hypothetical protein
MSLARSVQDMSVNVSAVVSVRKMGVETIVRATEDRQMATQVTNFQRCGAVGDDSVSLATDEETWVE